MNKTLFGKILLMSLLIILVVSGVTAVVMNFYIKQFILLNKQQDMLRQGERVASSFIKQMQMAEGMMGMSGMMRNRGMWVTRTRSLVKDLETIIGGRIWMIDREGQVYIGGTEFRQLTQDELRHLLSGRYIIKRNLVDEAGHPVLAAAIPIYMEGEVWGGLFMVTPMREILSAQGQVRRIILNSALLGAIVAVLMAFIFSRNITKPLLAMQRLIGQIRQGDFSGKLEVSREDELGELARHFNDLNSELRETIGLLSKEKEQTKRIINSMAEGMVSVNQEGEVLIINPAARRILQATNLAEEELNTVLQNLPGLTELTQQVWQEKEPLLREIKHNGQIFYVTVSPIITGEQLSGVVIVLRDVTNRWRLVELQKELVANVSHEFKTPLTSIKGFVELMLDNKISDQKVTDNALRIIHHETSRLTRMVNDLLTMARLEAQRIQKEPTCLRTLLENVVESLSFKLEEAEVEVVLDGSVTQTLLLDADRMERVFYNLIDNALRYTPKGSTIQVVAEERGEVLEIRVRDEGPGIPESEQELVFDRFYKVGKARSANDAGFGLGLAIVKSIIEEHGGQIWVNNHPEGGAIFTLQLLR